MGKLTTYLLMISGILLLMWYGGILTETNSLLGMLLSPENFSESPLTGVIMAAFAITASLGVYLAAWAVTGNREKAALAPVAIFILGLGYDFIQVYIKLKSLSPNFTPILVLIFAPILLIFTLTIIEWWNGVTT